MSTQKQIRANRRNALKSTGPTSPAGKAASSMNALGSGIHAVTEVLPDEDHGAHDALVAFYYSHHRPRSPEACYYLDEMIYTEWLLRRLRSAETELWVHTHEKHWNRDESFPLGQPCESNARDFAHVQARIDANRRAYRAAEKSFREVHVRDTVEPVAEAVDGPAPTLDSIPPTPTIQVISPKIGFVPITQPQAVTVPPAAALEPPNVSERTQGLTPDLP